MAFVQASASVQTTGASSLSPSLTGVVSGNSLVYCIAMWNGGTPSSTPPTNYTEDVESAAHGNGKCAMGSRLSAPSGTNTPSIGMAASSWGRAYLLEYDTFGAVDSSNSGTGTSATASAGAVSPAATTNILVACMSHNTGDRTLTPNASWTQRAETEDTGSGQPINIEERTGVTGSQTATWTINTSVEWSAAVVNFSIPVASAYTPPSLMVPKSRRYQHMLVR